MATFFAGDNTRKIINDTINRGAPYYPFENVVVKGDYRYTDGNTRLFMDNYRKGAFGIGADPGADLLLDVAEGWEVDIELLSPKPDFASGVPNKEITGFLDRGAEVSFTLNGNMNGHLYVSTRDGDERVRVEASNGSYAFSTEGGWVSVKIKAVRSIEDVTEGVAPPSQDDLADYTEERDAGEPIVIDDYSQDGDEDVIVVEEPTEEIEPPMEMDGSATRALVMGIVLVAVGYIAWNMVRRVPLPGGEDGE